jgi:hypothetical protein
MPFQQVRDLSKASASMVKQRMQQMQTELMQLTTDWEKSGQGDGGLIETGDHPDQSNDKTVQRSVTWCAQ